MSKIATLLSDYPTRGRMYSGASYGFFSYGIGPLLLSFFGFGFELSVATQVWVQIAYYLLNAVVTIGIFARFLGDSFLYVQLNPRKFIARVADGVALILMVGAVAFGLGVKIDDPCLREGVLPITEMTLFAFPTVIIEQHPVVGMLCLVLVTPVSTSLLYYATVFARPCGRSPWRAYLLMAAILAIPRIVNALTFWIWQEQAVLYLAQLPIHLLACRTYQKADTIWAPIATHIIANLIACLVWLIAF